LLGHPWLHKYGIVASTYHQCPKYHCSGKKKINSDVKPFTKVKPHFVNSKFFEEGTIAKETIPSMISSIGKGGSKAIKNSRVIQRYDGVK